MSGDITSKDLADIVKAILPHLPQVQSIERADVHQRDVIIFECVANMSQAAIQRIYDHAKMFWPDNRVVVIDAGIKLKVLRERDVKVAPGIEDAASMIRQAIRVAEQDSRDDGIEEILTLLVERAKQQAINDLPSDAEEETTA